MRDVYVISKEVFRALEEKGRTWKNINELIGTYKTSPVITYSLIMLRGVRLVCKHDYRAELANNIEVYRPGHYFDDYYVWDDYKENTNEPAIYISYDAMNTLQENGMNDRSEIIDAYNEQNIRENEVLAFRNYNDRGYVVIQVDTDNTKYHYIIRDEEYWWYKSMINNTEPSVCLM